MAVQAQIHSFHLSARDAVSAEAQAATFTAPVGSVSQVINLREPGEVRAWAQALGCSEAKLRLAVAAVGPELDEVCSHLGTLVPAQLLNSLADQGTAH